MFIYRLSGYSADKVDVIGLYRKWDSINLVYRILGGLAIGVVLALIVPGSPYIALLGSAFIWALKAVAPFLVLFLVINTLAKSGQNLGPRFRRVIRLYLASTIIASIVAVVFSFVHPVMLTFTGEPEVQPYAGDIAELLSTILAKIICNPITALVEANFLGILFWAVIIGLFLRKMVSETTMTVCNDASDILMSIIKVVINFAPFGILGLIYDTVSTSGMEIFTEYGELILILVASMLTVMFVTNPLLVFLHLRKNPYPILFACLKGSAVTAFFTRSSAANIPVNMKLCEDMGLDKDFYSVSIPLGATINMDGAAITITVMTLAAAFTLGVDVPIYMAAVLCIVAALSACGASGVNGGSLLLIPLACSLLGINGDVAMQLVAIGFIIGVIQDSLETALNSSSDVLFTATADYCDRRDREKVQVDGPAE